MFKSLRNQMVFLTQFGKQFETTGSLVASSRFLAKAITRFLAARPDHPIRVLECGPGTGAFTNQIVQKLQPGDAFDLVEVNESFVDVLNQRFESEKPWQAVRGLSTIHEVPLQDFETQGNYDFVISGLPLNNFPPRLVAEIMEVYFRLLKPGGMLSYFEYMYIRPVRSTMSPGVSGNRIREIHRIVESYFSRHRVARDSVLLNTPPAWVQHLQAKAIM
ncbi:MAG: methyltransferase domain-containing protein [Fuerstiella sp.]|nr:methyltransferase domain-containing protein [Fuerstiella sp.]